MLEAQARVISVKSNQALVETLQQSGCGHCSAAGGCGSGTLSKLSCFSKSRSFWVSNPVSAHPGEEVVVSVPEGAVLRGVVVGYLLPLFGLMLGAGVGSSWLSPSGNADLIAVLGAMSGLMMGFLLARRLTRQNPQPYISRR